MADEMIHQRETATAAEEDARDGASFGNVDLDTDNVEEVPSFTQDLPKSAAAQQQLREEREMDPLQQQQQQQGGSENYPPPLPPMLESVAAPFEKLGFFHQLGLLALVSLVVLMQSSVNCSNGAYDSCTGPNAFGIAGPVLSLALSAAVFYLEFKARFPSRAQVLVALVQFVWWTIIAVVLTFFGPFSSVLYANGYFATWTGFFVALLLFWSSNAKFKDAVGRVVQGVSRRPAAFLLIASVVELGAAVPHCVPQMSCHSLNAFAVALGVVSLAVAILLLLAINKMSVPLIRQIAVFLCVWWLVGGLLVTFISPFATMGNGYFAVLGGLASSLLLLQTKDEGEEEEHQQQEEASHEGGNMV